MAKRVLPAPALPHTSVGRPAGSPPPVISSKPAMPVSSFCRPATLFERLGRFVFLNQQSSCRHTRAGRRSWGTKGGGCREFITHLGFFAEVLRLAADAADHEVKSQPEIACSVAGSDFQTSLRLRQ